jgi:homocitrate synthase NifV
MGGDEILAIREISRLKERARISVWCRLSEKDIIAARECAADVIHISAPVSRLHIWKKLGKSEEWVERELDYCVKEAMRTTEHVTVGFEDASRADPAFLRKLAAKLREMEVEFIRFADTVGVLTPSSCERAISELISASLMDIEFHAHNDFGMAVANSIAALRAGAKYVDTTLLGVGERAGNCSFSGLLIAAGGVFDLGVRTADARSAESEFQEAIS